MPNDLFPEGVQFGFYYNYCAEADWHDSGARSTAGVCCQVGAGAEERRAKSNTKTRYFQEGKYRSCDELPFEEEVDGTYPSAEQREKINSLAAKLESGEPLSEEEVAELRKHIEGLRATAEFLLKEAADLEAKLP